MIFSTLFVWLRATSVLLVTLCQLCLWLSFLCLLLMVICLALMIIYLRLWVYLKRGSPNAQPSARPRVAFFHPYCNAGGGGERVLWCAIRAWQRSYPDAKYYVFTGDVDAAPDQIVAKARQRFQLSIDGTRVEFIYLHRRAWVEAARYPYFTLLGQSLGSLVLGLEAMDKCVPDVFVDTMGYAFTLPLFKYIARAKVCCYVHYPTISTDMLLRVGGRVAGYNNRRFIAQSRLATLLKLQYYRLFAWLYGVAGHSSDCTMVNSSWTEEHIKELWNGGQIHKVYPPCDVSEFSSLEPLAERGAGAAATRVVADPAERGAESATATTRVVSLAQFRPEKDHAMQIRTFAALRDRLAWGEWEKVRLILIGGCRNSEDERLVADLKDACKHLNIDDNVEFKVNLPFDELKDEMRRAVVGIHTMWNEHFGIGVVEMMAAGLLVVAHRSGGPLMDIVVEEAESRNGFLAASEEEYADIIKNIIENLTDECRAAIRERAKASTERFSDQRFELAWLTATQVVMDAATQ